MNDDLQTMGADAGADLPPRAVKRNRSDRPTAPRRVTADGEAAPTVTGTIDDIDRQLASGSKMSRERRNQLRRMRTKMLMEADNPFVNERPGALPVVDWERDRNHVYHWTRVALAGERDGDRSNLAAKMTGHMRYEYVKLADLPDDWQARLSPFGMTDGLIGYKDVRLTRVNRRLRDMKLAVMENEADQMADQINGKLRASIGGRGNTRASVEEDLEEMEVRDL
jgi:hypothetical protein